MTDKIGIIGGSGVYNLKQLKVICEHRVETPFGIPSDFIVEAELNGGHCFFLARHGQKHKILPHEVNYRANIYALKKLGVRYLISVSAVGSLKEELPPTQFVLVDQFIDWTKGGRARSFFGDGIVAHVSVAEPVQKNLMELIAKSCKKLALNHTVGGSYLCIEGPQFSSRAESNVYRSFGASVIGMTNVPESYLAKEAGIAYSTIAMVTDYDCWKEEFVTVNKVMETMKINNTNVEKLLLDVIPYLNNNRFEFEKENAKGVMTALDGLNSSQKEILDTLLK